MAKSTAAPKKAKSDKFFSDSSSNVHELHARLIILCDYVEKIGYFGKTKTAAENIRNKKYEQSAAGIRELSDDISVMYQAVQEDLKQEKAELLKMIQVNSVKKVGA